MARPFGRRVGPSCFCEISISYRPSKLLREIRGFLAGQRVFCFVGVTLVLRVVSNFATLQSPFFCGHKEINYMRITTFLASFLLGLSLFAQQPSRDPNSTTAPKGQSSTVGDPHEGTLTAPADKALAYDKWTEKQKLSVAKGMGHDMSKMSSAERTDAWGKMTADEKAAAYDYYSSHEGKAKKTN